MKRARVGLIGVAAAVVLACALPSVASGQVGVVNTTDDLPSDGVCAATPDGCSLRDAIDDPLIETVQLPGPVYSLGALGQLLVDDDKRIMGVGSGLVTIRAVTGPDIPPHRVLQIAPDFEVELSRVRITGGVEPSDNGGGILVESTALLTIIDSEVSGNRAVVGGGIWADGALTVRNSLIASNRAVGTVPAGGLGGGVGIGARIQPDPPAPALFTNVTLSGNVAEGQGGGIFMRRSTSLFNTTIVDNSAPPRANAPVGAKGGGLYQDFAGDDEAGTLARSVLLARNGDASCGGTANDPIDSLAGMTDELALPSCNVGDPTQNSLVDGPAILVGPLANNGGLTRTHALLAGSPAIDRGVACAQDDQRGVARPVGADCDIGAFEFVPSTEQPGGGQPPPPPPPPPPDDDEDLPPPEAGKNVNVEPEGTVKIKIPGTNKFVALTEDQQLPVGTIVDTLKGSVVLKTAGGGSAKFYDGIFKIAQGKGAKPLTVLTLVEKLSCPSNGKASAAAKGKKKRRLWGDGKGRFQTKGKHSAATVVGTKWLIEDTCTTTRVRVVKGKVRVDDFVKKKSVTVKAGKEYIAKARRP